MSVRNKSSGEVSVNTDWDAVAEWYNRHVGKWGSSHQRLLAIPAALELLDLKSGEQVLDIGARQGVLAPYVAKLKAHYTGVEASNRLLQFARKHHGREGRFLLGDARRLWDIPELAPNSFEAVVFLLSLQDMDPLSSVLSAAAWALRKGGRVVALMTHPCFRVPRQSGWGWDELRKLRYRRIDRYLSSLAVPMAPHVKGRKGTATRSFHYPLQTYINGLAECGLFIDALKEIPGLPVPISHTGPENRANQEIPLFLGLRARKLGE